MGCKVTCSSALMLDKSGKHLSGAFCMLLRPKGLAPASTNVRTAGPHPQFHHRVLGIKKTVSKTRVSWTLAMCASLA